MGATYCFACVKKAVNRPKFSCPEAFINFEFIPF